MAGFREQARISFQERLRLADEAELLQIAKEQEEEAEFNRVWDLQEARNAAAEIRANKEAALTQMIAIQMGSARRGEMYVQSLYHRFPHFFKSGGRFDNPLWTVLKAFVERTLHGRHKVVVDEILASILWASSKEWTVRQAFPGMHKPFADFAHEKKGDLWLTSDDFRGVRAANSFYR